MCDIEKESAWVCSARLERRLRRGGRMQRGRQPLQKHPAEMKACQLFNLFVELPMSIWGRETMSTRGRQMSVWGRQTLTGARA